MSDGTSEILCHRRSTPSRLSASLAEETLVVDRHNLECLDRRLARLHEAITMAMGQGDPLARRVRGASVDSTLDKLMAVFLERAQGTK